MKYFIQRHFYLLKALFFTAFALIIITLLSLSADSTTHAASTITVTNVNDSGAGSLRQAIADAESGDTIDFSPDLPLPIIITLTSDSLNINKDLTIQGPGAGFLIIDGNNAHRVFTIGSGDDVISVKISGAAIRNGKDLQGGGIILSGNLELNQSIVSGSEATDAGGGIRLISGKLTLIDSVVTKNKAPFGGGMWVEIGPLESGEVALVRSVISFNEANVGGGIATFSGDNHILTLTDNSQVINNSAQLNGGGISNGGVATLTDSVVSGNTAKDDGGGIYNSSPGKLTLNDNSKVIENTADGNGGGIFNGGMATLNSSAVSDNNPSDDGNNGEPKGDNGGGIANTGTLKLNNSVVSGNFVENQGGGIYNESGDVTLMGSAISGNKVTIFGEGGGIFNRGKLEIHNSALDKNDSGYGGGIADVGGTVKLTNSTVSRNKGDVAVGGIGAAENSKIILINSTVSSNMGGRQGGILLQSNAELELANSAISHNKGGSESRDTGGVLVQESGTVRLKNTIIAANTGTAPDCENTVGGTIVSLGHNLIGNGDSCNSLIDGSNGDQVGSTGSLKNPMLDPELKNNGGSTETHALLAGSPAIDAGNPGGCTDTDGVLLATDQRGVVRHLDGDGNGNAICDIGAFEAPAKVTSLLNLAGRQTSYNTQTMVFSIAATFQNTSGRAIEAPFFRVVILDGAGCPCAVTGFGGVGSEIPINAGPDGTLSPGESFEHRFEISLTSRASFRFFVDVFGN